MRLVIAPDGFGGTLSPAAAARALGEGWSAGAPGDEVDLCPLSDGGPGLVEVLQTALPGSTVVPVVVEDALARPVDATVLLDGRTAYVESALACGLHLLAPEERDPRAATTYGVGQLLLAALDAGATRIVVGLGGSATNDGGAGMLAALGLGRVDAAGQQLAPGGTALADAVALSGELDARLAGVELLAATDVDAPLLGPRGASAVFGPQKGATPDDVRALDAALGRWADVLEDALGVQVRDAPGAGAAGGLGAALLALGAAREPGFALVARRREARRAGGRRRPGAHRRGHPGRHLAHRQGRVGRGRRGGRAAGVPCVVLAGQVQLGRREQAPRAWRGRTP